MVKVNGNKLRTLADGLTKQIDAKFNSGVSQQNPTPRRARIAESMRKAGEELQGVQSVLYGLADGLDAGTLPDCVAGLKSKAVISDILMSIARLRFSPDSWSFADYDGRLKKAGVNSANFDEVATVLDSYIVPPSAEQIAAKKIAKLERELLGVKIDGFFPTPASVIDLMLQHAGIDAGNSMLEPSAGKGDIADKLREQYPDNPLQVIEINYTLRCILAAKEHELIEADFTRLDPSKSYDRIVMNPPFEKFTDVDHIRFAYDHLNEGGRVVCIMGEAPFFRTDTKAVDFRSFLDDLGGYSIKLENAFKGAESFRQTGVVSRLVVIDK